MNKVNMQVGLQSEYDALEVKDTNTLYFIMDTHRIYKGVVLFACGLIENLMQEDTITLYGGTADVEEENR